MTEQQPEMIDVPLAYPKVTMKLKTTINVGGRIIEAECEELFDFEEGDPDDLPGYMGDVAKQFIKYLADLRASVESPEAQAKMAAIEEGKA